MGVASFGSWPSRITADVVVAGVKRFSGLSSNGTALFWRETRPREAGRVTLVTWNGATVREMTPAPFNVRTRVHEYGGGAHCVTPTHVHFVNLADQDLYSAPLDAAPVRRLTSTGPERRYADLVHDGARNRLLCVCEHHAEAETRNFIVAIDLATGSERVLHEGRDFYAAPRLSADGQRLCFVTWDHPNMPWDGTQLHVARIARDGGLVDLTVLAGGVDESVIEPQWLAPDRLAFISDRTGYWNLYVYDESGIYCVHEEPADYAEPPWAFGSRSYVPVGTNAVACARTATGEQSLSLITLDHGFASPVETPWIGFESLTMHQGRVWFIGYGAARSPAIVGRDLSSGEDTIVAEAATDALVDAALVSRAERLEFPTTDGSKAHGYFYQPHNPEWQAPPETRPPLLVLTHGGPTAAAHRALNLRIQYYTSRGWAVLDVNYGGSTGFGRAYRQRLEGRWGIVDVQDCVAGVDHLSAAGRVDPERIAIAGGSAGGYTTLAALTFTDRFDAGASHYGIGDLEALARDTHKFESRYLDSLVGPLPAARDRYLARSPIHHVERLACPVIFFQGLEDRVVPPNQAEAMVEALRRKRVPVAYLAFPGEQHGFRDARNIKRALEAEYLFFATVFRIECAENLPPIEIENLSNP